MEVSDDAVIDLNHKLHTLVHKDDQISTEYDQSREIQHNHHSLSSHQHEHSELRNDHKHTEGGLQSHSEHDHSHASCLLSFNSLPMKHNATIEHTHADGSVCSGHHDHDHDHNYTKSKVDSAHIQDSIKQSTNHHNHDNHDHSHAGSFLSFNSVPMKHNATIEHTHADGSVCSGHHDHDHNKKSTKEHDHHHHLHHDDHGHNHSHDIGIVSSIPNKIDVDGHGHNHH